MSQGSHEVEKFYPVIQATVKVTEVYAFHSSGACPVSYDLLRLTCEREADCRASGRYAECRLGDDYDLCST